MENVNDILTEISQFLDISPSDFKRAQERYKAVRDWLLGGYYESGYSPNVYLQGSFRLGTVERPYYKDKDGDFDIDQVCELTPIYSISPSKLKKDIGDRLKENSDYSRMLKVEGTRCWTIEYASDDNRPGFHIDVLPSVSSNTSYENQIDITHKEHGAYTWAISNPNGYYLWFKSKNIFSDQFKYEEKKKIYEGHSDVFDNFEDVPIQLLRSPLQRAIQIMKRHRDVYFVNRDNKPISIIITTISAHVSSNSSVIDVIEEFVSYCGRRYEDLLQDAYIQRDGILDFVQGKWTIPNPVDEGLDENNVENFADKWNDDNNLVNAFFKWIRQLKRDLTRFKQSGVSSDLNLRTEEIGSGLRYVEALKKEVERKIELSQVSNHNLLQLIHLGIEGKVDWETVFRAAKNELELAGDKPSEDVALVNKYQVALHQGIPLSSEAIEKVREILERNKNSSRYVMCCNLLLGSATLEMVKRCIRENRGEEILSWPITRLFDFSKEKI